MKSHYYVLLIVVLVSVFSGAYLFGGHLGSTRSVALQVNDLQLSPEALQTHLATPALAHLESGEAVESLVTRFLLIQEAQRSGIDRQEDFRQMVQNFYEESLIKALIDLKHDALQVEVSAKDIDFFLEQAHKVFELRLQWASGHEDALQGRFEHDRTDYRRWEDLPPVLRRALLTLQIGQSSAPLELEQRYVVLSLSGVEEPQETLAVPSRQEVAEILSNEQERKLLDDWLENLRSSATVEISPEVLGGGNHGNNL